MVMDGTAARADMGPTMAARADIGPTMAAKGWGFLEVMVDGMVAAKVGPMAAKVDIKADISMGPMAEVDRTDSILVGVGGRPLAASRPPAGRSILTTVLSGATDQTDGHADDILTPTFSPTSSNTWRTS